MIQDQSEVYNYEEVTVLNREHMVSVVRNRENGRIFLKKTMPVYNRAIYEQLSLHPIANIPRIYEVHEDADKQLLTVIEEYISGSTLQDVLDAKGTLDKSSVISYGIQLCNILNDLHHATPVIIHRDIKPSNVIVTDDNRLVLIDLNAAKYYEPNQSRDTRLLGTQGYAAPEQFGFGASIPQTDLYALGVLMTTLLTGSNSVQNLPNGKLAKIIRKCTKLDPTDRYENALQVKTALQNLSYPSHKKWILILLSVLFIIVLGTLLALLLRRDKQNYISTPPNEIEGISSHNDKTIEIVSDPAEKVVSSPVGVYIGNDDTKLVLSKDELAYYYFDDPTFTDLACPYTYDGDTLSIELAKLHCKVSAKINNGDFSEMLLISDSGNWNAEMFRKTNGLPEDYLKRTVKTHNPNVAVHSDGTMHFILNDISFTVPKYYCDFYDEASEPIDNYIGFTNVDVEHNYSGSLAFFTENSLLIDTVLAGAAESTAQIFCERFFNDVSIGKFTRETIAGRPSYLGNISGNYNDGFGTLTGGATNGKLAMVLDEQNNCITYILFAQTENNSVDYSGDFNWVLSKME